MIGEEAFRVLVVNLTDGKSEPVLFGDPSEMLGGSGLAAGLFAVHGITDGPADHPDQPLIFATGPLTAYFPLMSKVVLGFKPPYNGQYAESHAGGGQKIPRRCGIPHGRGAAASATDMHGFMPLCSKRLLGGSPARVSCVCGVPPSRRIGSGSIKRGSGQTLAVEVPDRVQPHGYLDSEEIRRSQYVERRDRHGLHARSRLQIPAFSAEIGRRGAKRSKLVTRVALISSTENARSGRHRS